MALAKQQIEDFRVDIDDADCAFTEAEIQRLYARAGTYEGMVLLAIDQIIASTSKLYQYRQNTTQENLDEIVQHLNAYLRPIWQERSARAGAKQTIRFVRLGSTENPRREKPTDGSDSDA
jgi:hypothetical protein